MKNINLLPEQIYDNSLEDTDFLPQLVKNLDDLIPIESIEIIEELRPHYDLNAEDILQAFDSWEVELLQKIVICKNLRACALRGHMDIIEKPIYEV